MTRPKTTQLVIDLFTSFLDSQDKKGIEKYGVSIDQATGYDWNAMAMEEIADFAKYVIKENQQLQKRIQDALETLGNADGEYLKASNDAIDEAMAELMGNRNDFYS